MSEVKVKNIVEALAYKVKDIDLAKDGRNAIITVGDLGGAVTGFETFGSHLGDSDTTYYVCTCLLYTSPSPRDS